MILTLARHTFVDEPNWIIVKETVPLGTEYTLVQGPVAMIIQNTETGKTRKVNGVLVSGNGDIGWLPMEVFGD